ncbi:MAG: 2-amino-4-hydroxy-6-hydroxymethyldihydropteridine diphosphokinase [Dehalococcoidia bacterium]|nr:2-amino-4-hydroxy-6-hydroxymethyldihydropteridine diphosphokinase [Dehalococcoidia bacterium]
MGQAYLGLGSNLGNRRENLRMALGRLQPLVRVDAVSALYETVPVGVEEQPRFLNAVARVTTGLRPPALLRLAKSIEEEVGRRPGPVWGPRPVDIDILLMGDEVVDSPVLVIPHPRLRERAFVLLPLRDLALALAIPGSGESVAALAERVGAEGVRRVEEMGWERSGRGAWLDVE